MLGQRVGVEVAVARRRARARRRLRTCSASRPTRRARPRPRPTRPASRPSAGRAMRNEYAHTVVLCRSFWLQSTNTLPLRSSFAMSPSRASGRVDRAADRARARTPWSVVVGRRSSSRVQGHREVQPLAARRLHDRDSTRAASSRSRQLERDAAAVETSAGAPGSRSNTIARGRVHGRRASTGACAARARRGSRATPASGGPRRCSCAGPPFGLEPGPMSTQSGGAAGSASRRTARRRRRRASARGSAAGRPGGAASPARSGGSSR